MSRKLHRHALRNPRADHVPHGGSPEIVRNPTGAPRRVARRLQAFGYARIGVGSFVPPPPFCEHPEEHQGSIWPAFSFALDDIPTGEIEVVVVTDLKQEMRIKVNTRDRAKIR